MKTPFEETTGRRVSDEDRADETQRLNAIAAKDQPFITHKSSGDDEDDDLTKPVEVPGDE